MAAEDITGGGYGQPATHVFSITPSDSSELSVVTRALYVGNTGDVSVMLVQGTIAVFARVPTGQVLSIRARKVFATGTTATNLVGMA